MSTPAVFLSYASQDAAAARRISEALRAAGIEVWLDQEGGLVGGDVWDRKIREQINACALFVPIISANTQARLEGYFRLEWKLAAQRTHTMADERTFLLPVVIDDTRDADAKVPLEFKAVQWTRLRPAGYGGQAPEGSADSLAAFCERVTVLVGRPSAPRTVLGGEITLGGPSSAEAGHGGSTAASAELGPPARNRRRGWAWGALAAVLGLGAWIFLARTAPAAKPVAESKPSSPSPAAQPPPDFASAKSVAVLAFRNLSGDPAREFFSDGLSEAVTDVLGRVPGLKVIGSASAFSFKGKSVSIPEMARQLGVTHLVEGTVLQEGQTVRITAKLIQADGFQVWISDKLDRELKNIFALHDEVAGLIAKNLSLKLGASSAASKAAVNPEAFELYLQARQALSLPSTESLPRAENALNRVLALEPNFARAHAALADVWTQRFRLAQRDGAAEDQFGPSEKARIMAKITQALTLDPDSAEAHTSLGFLLRVDGKFSEAESALRRAVGLNPNDASTQNALGRALLSRAQMDEALEHLKLSTELDPLSSSFWGFYGEVLRNAGRTSDGIKALDRSLALRPDIGVTVAFKSFALLDLGRVTEAVALVRQMPSGGSTIAGAKLRVFAQAGLKAEAEALLAASRSPANTSFRWAAGSLVALGRTEEALALMTSRSIVSAVSDYLWDPILDPVRTDPRWVRLMADAGLTEAHARAQAWRAAHPPEQPAPR